MKKTNDKYMKMLDKVFEFAKTSNHYPFKLACFVTDKKLRIISKAVNMMKTHPKVKQYNENDENDYFLHAEVSAIVKSKSEGDYLFVSIYIRDGHIGMSKPCEICERIIKEDTNISKVFYTINDNEYGVLVI